MLLAQKICLQWDKKERGVKGENVRRRFPHAYLLEKLPLRDKDGVFVQSTWDSYTSEWHTKRLNDGIFVHNLHFYQQKELILDAIQHERYVAEKYFPQWGWEPKRIAREVQKNIAWIKRFQYDFNDIVDTIEIENISICGKEDKYELSYVHHCGAPVRRGHNKDYQNINSPFYQKDRLNETAFVLSPGQYGRIVWNERKTDYDTGEWYYQLHIFNLFYPLGETVKRDSFTKSKPDYVYKQLAYLY
ncbi:MAG: hypothetical protein HFH74_00185 [Lachnospiraceae bacterium]|jgi:hypothetical protein|nr:hypothetical protein [Lachnospiraceae bacterium]